ncbi:hypothetical protein [Clostridium sp.]|uniref:hypothetical protein n=1 Tax=Clostridium sp. TaxID=1506 RepID=UPI002851DBB2|nr:hypothetical protein [Clostridium sp.]MDR3595869.1 hypothetical protein [Clostridium sp.]
MNDSNDNIKVEKLDLKKDKIDSIANYDPDKTKNVDVYIVKNDDDSDQDIAADVQGWSIDEGKIYKFDKLDNKVMYTCGRSLEAINDYN